MKMPQTHVGRESMSRGSNRSPNERQGIAPQGCNPFTCGAKVISCAAACASGVGTLGCIACLGSAYDSCKDCF